MRRLYARSKRILYAALFGIGLIASTDVLKVVAEDAPPQPVGKSAIDERTSELRAFRERLRSSDDIERSAAFEFGMASSDPLVKELTLKEALRSKDKGLQTLALRSWIANRRGIVVRLEMPERPSEATVKAHNSWYGDSLFIEVAVGEKGELTAMNKQPPTQLGGQFVPGGLVLMGIGAGIFSTCHIDLTVVDDTRLSGAMRCKELDPMLAEVQMEY